MNEKFFGKGHEELMNAKTDLRTAADAIRDPDSGGSDLEGPSAEMPTLPAPAGAGNYDEPEVHEFTIGEHGVVFTGMGVSVSYPGGGGPAEWEIFPTGTQAGEVAWVFFIHEHNAENLWYKGPPGTSRFHDVFLPTLQNQIYLRDYYLWDFAGWCQTAGAWIEEAAAIFAAGTGSAVDNSDVVAQIATMRARLESLEAELEKVKKWREH